MLEKVLSPLSSATSRRRQAGHGTAREEASDRIGEGSITVSEVDIADLPLYNQDYDDTTIDSYERVRAQLKAADAVLIVTPEHNRTMPAALKNVVDIASRPFKRECMDGQKSSVSDGITGQFRRH